MLPGFGDKATWGRCYGHPHDPRTPEYDDEENDMSFDGTTYTLRDAADKLETIDRLLDDLVTFFDELHEEPETTETTKKEIDYFIGRMRDI